MSIVKDAGILIYKYEKGKRHFLFLRKGKHFDLPKGHAKRNETCEDAALRETKEETGIEAKLVPHFEHDIIFRYKIKGRQITTHICVYLAQVRQEEIKLSREHSGFAWLTFEEIARSRSIFENEKELVRHADAYIRKKEALERVNKAYKKLTKTGRWRLSRNFVPGEGPADAKIMLVGQAPGKNEDKEGRPFVGASGRLLDKLLKLAGIERRKAYITSVVQFYPPGNRAPTKNEINICKAYLEKQISIISPKVIILLGSVAANALAGKTNIMREHGKTKGRYFITLHPAAAVRLKRNLPLIENDFRALRKLVEQNL
ncbi:MAG: uracil-DNA glycosylase family protein [Candidatus Micrarchaeia archaeon]